MNRLDQNVRNQAHREQHAHDVERKLVQLRASIAAAGLALHHHVDDQRARHTRRGPRGEQPSVDRADLVHAEEVAQVCRDGGKPAAVEGEQD